MPRTKSSRNASQDNDDNDDNDDTSYEDSTTMRKAGAEVIKATTIQVMRIAQR